MIHSDLTAEDYLDAAENGADWTKNMPTDDQIVADVMAGRERIIAELGLCASDASVVRKLATELADKIDALAFELARKAAVRDPGLVGAAILAVALRTIDWMHEGCKAQENGR